MGGARTAGREWRAALALGAAALVASLVLAIGPGAAPASAACPHAGAHPRQVPLPKLRKAVTCLVNHERKKRGRPELKPNGQLQTAAQGHTDVMLAKDCFRHDCPGERGLSRRVKRSGYLKGQRAWGFAEDLGFDKTPRRMVKTWMHSGFNRRNLLDGRFLDVGVGVGRGAPKRGLDDRDFATYTILFAFRRPG
jgi:uncharacterized protein YkwD